MFPQFYLHYDTKTDKTLKVDRDNTVEGPFVLVIALEEELSKKLLSGEIAESALIVNKYADPPYVIDKALFPKDADFGVLFDLDSLEITKITAKKPTGDALMANRQGFAPVDNRIAFSILAGDTGFGDWKIRNDDDGHPIVVHEPVDEINGSSLFKHRVDFLTLAEIPITKSRNTDKSIPKLCDICVDCIRNSITIECSNQTEEHFSDFFLAITNKNDPSYLIKTIQFAPGKKFKLEFNGKRLDEMSFFTSRFHLRNTQIEVLNNFTGRINVEFKKKKIIVKNDLTFNANLSTVTIILRNKYDRSQVYRALSIEDNSPIEIACNSVDPKVIEIDSLNISKKFITISR